MISFIVPTIGRPSLRQTLASIETRDDDEILVIGQIPDVADERPVYIDCHSGHDWGCKERTIGLEMATQPYLAFIDDDDVYLPGARQLMAEAIARWPDRPVLFRMRYPNGAILWRDPVLRCGNVSTAQILIPNDRMKLGAWTTRREGDYDFLASMQWPVDQIVWRTEVISLLGHNDGV